MDTNSIDEDILTMNESAALRQFSPPASPLCARNVDQIDSEHIVQQLSIGEEKSHRPKSRKTISGYLKNTTFKPFQPSNVPNQRYNYRSISTGLCRIPTLQAMAIVGLRSSTEGNEKQPPIFESYHFSGTQKSSTFSGGPFVPPKNKPNTSSNEEVFSSLLVTSSSPNLSPQIFATKTTNVAPFMDRGSKSNLILNPVFENLRPHILSIPVERVTSPSKG